MSELSCRREVAELTKQQSSAEHYCAQQDAKFNAAPAQSRAAPMAVQDMDRVIDNDAKRDQENKGGDKV